MPAPSYFEQRLKLPVAVPGLLLSALVIATVSRAVRPSSSTLPLVGMAALLVLTRQVPPTLASDAPVGSLRDLVGSIRSWDLGAGGRVFASPNEHLILTYYSGRPVQSIAPIRKEWLGRFAADLVVIEGPWFEPLSIAEVQATARRLGRELAPEQAKSRADDTPRLAVVLDLLASGSRAVSPPPAPDDLDRVIALVLAGVALMLWSVLPGTAPEALWTLLAVPLVPLLVAAGCLAAARAGGNGEAFGGMRGQLLADLALLREPRP